MAHGDLSAYMPTWSLSAGFTQGCFFPLAALTTLVALEKKLGSVSTVCPRVCYMLFSCMLSITLHLENGLWLDVGSGGEGGEWRGCLLKSRYGME